MNDREGGGAIVPANQGPKNVWGVKDYSLSGLFSTIIYWFNAAVLLFRIIDKVDIDGSSNQLYSVTQSYFFNQDLFDYQVLKCCLHPQMPC